MARMIPDYIHKDCKSSAERRLFERFSRELQDSFVVLHSLGLARHARKLRAEIDFVVINRRGLLCLEVKGGRIRQECGVWSFINRYDEVYNKRESPFEQASTAMFALRRGIEKKFGWKSPQRNGVIGYSVIFPDQVFSMESPEWDLNRLIDGDRADESMQKLIEDQFDYSASEILRTDGKECVDMAPMQMEMLLMYLRPDFDLVPSLSSRIRDSHADLLRLTEEQYEVLDLFDANARIMITGGAGAGKTLLAVEKIRREARNGKKVIYICYNRLLAMHIRHILKEESCGELIEINTLHGYARKLIASAGLDDALRVDVDNTLFMEKYPALFERAFVELFNDAPFDMLVVDEGQDLKAEAWLGMMDWLVQG